MLISQNPLCANMLHLVFVKPHSSSLPYCRDGNKQHAELSEAFSSGFTLGKHTDSQGGHSPARPAAESAANTKPQDMGTSGVETAQNDPAQPTSADHTMYSSRAASQPEANGTSKDESGKCKLGEKLAAQFAELTAQCKARPDPPSTGQPGRSGEPQSAASQAAAPTPGTGSLGGGSMGGRSLSDDSSADSGLPRGVLHHGSMRSPAKGAACLCLSRTPARNCCTVLCHFSFGQTPEQYLWDTLWKVRGC